MPKRPSKGDSEETNLFDLIRKVKYENDECCYCELCEYMKPYIDLFRNKFVIAGLSNDDIEQECLFALRYKAIDDFNPKRGKFKTFAVLCIKRHLFSIIKGNKQHKKKVGNIAVSIDENHTEHGEELMLRNVIASDEPPIDDQIQKMEDDEIRENKLMNRLSDFEKEVYVLYIQRYHYNEIVEILKDEGREEVNAKACDNAIQRLKTKAQRIFRNEDFC